MPLLATLVNPCSSFIGILLVFVIVVNVVFEFVVGNSIGRAIDGGGKFRIDVVGFFLVYGSGSCWLGGFVGKVMGSRGRIYLI